MRLPFAVPALVLLAAGTAQTALRTTYAFGSAWLCYDQARDRLVLTFGGRGVFEWDGQQWGEVGVPVPQYLYWTVYDPTRARVFCASYANGGGRLLEYDGHAFVDRGPCPHNMKIVADTHRGCLVGLAGTSTYEWSGGTWQQVASSNQPFLHAAYDPNRRVTVALLQSYTAPFGFETWEWDGTVWVLRSPSTTSLGPLAFDSVRQQVIRASVVDTQAWNGTTWTVLPTATRPAALGGFTTDPAHGRIWLFANSHPHNRYVWMWDGAQWSTPIELPHPALDLPNLTFDAARGRAVLLGSLTSWSQYRHHEWDGRRWHTIQAPAAAIDRSRHAQVFDSARAETLVFGGATSAAADTWAWNGTTWRVVATSGPPARSRAAITFDVGRARVVLYGGLGAGGALQDHWEWDGQSWTLVAATTPMAGALGILGHDPSRARTVLVEDSARTWEYDGAAWTQIPAFTPRPLEHSRELVWDPGRGRLLGTLASLSGTPNQFEWDGTAWYYVRFEHGEVAFDTVRGRLLNYEQHQFTTFSDTPASVLNSGSPCGGSTTSTSLTAFGVPRPGEAGFHLDVRADATLRPAMIGFGLAPASVPLGNGCTLLVQNAIGSLVWFTGGNGTWHQPVPLPNDVSLRATSLLAQAAVLDPASPGGIALSQRVTLVIGD